MSTLKSFLGGVFFGVLLALTPGCGPAKCSPSTCSGCCDTAGKCQLGTTAEACGQPGNTCQACFIGQVCSSGLCGTTGLGGGSGGGDVGGGTGGSGGSGGGATGGSAGGGSGGSGGSAGGGAGGGNTGGSAGGGTGGSGGGTAGPGDVTGTGTRTFLLADGGTTSDQPNLSTSQVGAWITLDGGLVYRMGTGQTNGTFVIPNVPQGPYLLRLNSTFYATSTRAVNLDFDTVGRPNAMPATIDPTDLTFNVSGLNPWEDYNYLSLISFNAGQSDLVGFEYYGTLAPTFGATSYAGTLNYFLYSNAFGSALIDSAQGDVAYLVQHDYVVDGGVGISNPVRSMEVSSLSMADGQLSTITGVLAAPPTTSFTYDYRAADFRVAATQLNAGTTSFFFGTLYQTPHARQSTVDSFAQTLYWYAYEPSAPPTTLAVGLPYGASWSTVAYVGYGTETPRTLPNATPMRFNSQFISIITLQALISAPVQPVLGPPVTARINGSDLLVDQSGVGTTPTLTWGAPTLGTPQRYRAKVDRLGISNGATRVAATFTFDTAGTSVTFPPGLLVAGQTYVITLSAYQTGGVVDPGFFNYRLPYHATNLVSGLIRP